MATKHTVQPGDCIESLGLQYGLTPETLWGDKANASLNEKRLDGHVLAPGDELTIAPLTQAVEACDTSLRHRFRRKSVPARLKLQLLDQGVARAGIDYTLEIEGQTLHGKTDDHGYVAVPLSPTAKTALLKLPEDEDYQLELGQLEPSDSDAGARQRLYNLGLLGAEQADAPAYATALSAYQALISDDVSGTLAEPTKRHLHTPSWIQPSEDPTQGSTHTLLSSVKAVSRAPRKVKVARSPHGDDGICLNVLDQPSVQLAFLYENETAADDPGPQLLRFETLELAWFSRVWAVLHDHFGGDLVLAALTTAMGNTPLPQVFNGLPIDLRRQLYRLHLRFMNSMLQSSDPAPVGLLELMAGTGFIRSEAISVCRWYVVEYLGSQPLQPLRNPEQDGELVYASLGLTPAADSKPTLHVLTRIRPLAELNPGLDAIMQGLHFPQFDPDGKPGQALAQGVPLPQSPGPVVRCDGADITIKVDEHDIPILQAAIKRRNGDDGAPNPKRRKLAEDGRYDQGPPEDEDDDMDVGDDGEGDEGEMDQGDDGSEGDEIGEGDDTDEDEDEQDPDEELPPPLLPPPPPPANPMIFDAGGYQPFVGVNHVGAGNNVALYGRNGQVIAFSDFGLPTIFNRNTFVDPDPCVCGDPLIFLSHWDYDHYAMVRQLPNGLRRRWIAPQQPFGSVAGRELYVRLLNEAANGAALELWPIPAGGAGPDHLMTDFGFLERAVGPVGNDDGLALYVRVEDGPVIPANALPAGFGARAAPNALGGGIVPGMVLNSPIVCAGGALSGELVRRGLAGPFNANMVAVSATVAGQFAVPAGPVPVAGAAVVLAGGLAARWIPAAGIARLAPFVGPNYVPSVLTAAGGPWAGGWAISARNFVAHGGLMMAFPPANAAAPFNTMMCMSPTPGTPWVAPPPALGAPVAPVAGAMVMPANAWNPIWGAGRCWAIPMPAALAVGLPPLPAGPGALVPVAGAPPVQAGERYVIQPGDAGYRHLPTMAGLAAPLVGAGAVVPDVIGLLASHHGSDSWLPAAGGVAAVVPEIPAAIGVDKIVYSYGVRPAGTHCYRQAGANGHPRLNAIAAYLARGWGNPPAGAALPATFHRLNTAPSDFNSAQAYNPLPIPVATAPGAAAHALGQQNGNVALGWDSAAAGPLTADLLGPGALAGLPAGPGAIAPLRRTCATCALVREYRF